MENFWLVRFYQPGVGMRVGVHQGDVVYDVTDSFPTVSAWLIASNGRVAEAIAELGDLISGVPHYPAASFENAPAGDQPHWLAPVDEQDVWAAGVTYERSREARQEEATDGGDVYARVYDATRPELFFKARGRWVIGQHGEVGVRADATWSVPEPELVLVMNPALEIVGLTAGNDVSSRDIEGENPLYLPQAKVYTASCSLGHGILLQPTAEFPQTQIALTIRRAGEVVFENSINTARIKRSARELVDYLGRSLSFPDGVLLLTGTGIVPPADFSLAAGDDVVVDIAGVSALHNTVRQV